VGCIDLFNAMKRVQPKLHVFGHIHEGYGKIGKEGMIYINPTICNEKYAPVNAGAIARLFAAPPIFKKTGYQAGSLIIFRMAQGPPVSTHYRATLLRLNPLLHQAEK